MFYLVRMLLIAEESFKGADDDFLFPETWLWIVFFQARSVIFMLVL